jgi:hypothetical protein
LASAGLAEPRRDPAATFPRKCRAPLVHGLNFAIDQGCGRGVPEPLGGKIG